MFALNSCKFCLASFLRLGLPIAFSSWTTTCNCGAFIDDSGYHLLTCKTGGGPVWSHESISSVWSDCFHGLHIHHHREPRSRYTTTDNRPDIVFFDLDTGNNVDLDISLAHPWSSDIFPSSAGVSATAERRADRKKEKYSKQQLPGGIIATVTPLVMQHFGAWGSMGGNSCANCQRSHRTKWDDQTLQSLSTSGPNAFLFSSRSVMLESSLKSYLVLYHNKIMFILTIIIIAVM